MKREELEKIKSDEVSSLLDKELKEFKAKVDTITDPDELQRMEDEVMREMDENDAYVRNVKYDLAKGVDYDGEHFSVGEIRNKIISFLNRSEVEWSYTLGLYQLVKFWKTKEETTITYPVYDSTLRILNTLKFKGFNDWKDILVVNEFFKGNHENYLKDTALVVFASQKHNTIVSRMDELSKKSETVNEDAQQVKEAVEK